MAASTCASSVVGTWSDRDAAHEDRRQEAGHVGDDPAAERDHHAGAVGSAFHHFVGEPFEWREALPVFPAGKEQHFVRDVSEAHAARALPWWRHTSAVETTKTFASLPAGVCCANLPDDTAFHDGGVAVLGRLDAERRHTQFGS